MAAEVYVGVNNKARRIRQLCLGVDGVAREVLFGDIGVYNIARLCYSSVIIISTLPHVDTAPVYTGSTLTPTWSDYDPDLLTIGGEYTGTNAGTYVATFTPKAGCEWSDGTQDTKSVEWHIDKAALPTPTLSVTSVTLDDAHLSNTVTVNRAGDGVITALSDDPTLVTTIVSGNIVTLSVGPADSSGNTEISITIAASDNYEAYEGTLVCAVTVVLSPIVWVDAPKLSGVTYEAKGTRAGTYALFQLRFSTLVDAFGYSLEKLAAPAGIKSVDGAAATITQKGAIGGGQTNVTTSGATVVSAVRIYDGSLSQIAAALSSGRFYLGAAGVDAFFLFAGGSTSRTTTNNIYVSSTVDAINSSGTRVDCPSLANSKRGMAGTNGKNHAIFAGGVYYNGAYSTLVRRSEVEAYDASLTKASSPLPLSSAGTPSAAGFFSNYSVFMNGAVANIYDEYLTKTQKTLTGAGWGGSAMIGMSKVLLSNYQTSKVVSILDDSLTEAIESSLHYSARRDIGTAYNGIYALFAGGSLVYPDTGNLQDVDAFYER